MHSEASPSQSAIPRRRPDAVALTVGALCAGFVALNIWAYRATSIDGPVDLITGPLRSLRNDIPSRRWTTVIAGDLIFGWCLIAFVITFVENRRRTAALWIAGVFLIGNLIAGLYLIRRLPSLRDALSAERDSPRPARLPARDGIRVSEIGTSPRGSIHDLRRRRR